LKDPTAVRAALTITISSGIAESSWTFDGRRRASFYNNNTCGRRLLTSDRLK
jgi:hypothetical protein